MSGKSLIIGMVLIVFLFSSGFILPRMAYAIPVCWDYLTQCHGDSDNDGEVKGSDFLALKNSWYKCYGDPNYNPCADFDRDGCVGGADFLTLKSNWFQSVPADCTPGDPWEIYLVWVYIDDPGVSGHESFAGYMSKYETTNAQYCEFLNAALVSGDITVNSNLVYGANGSNGGADFVGEIYFDTYAALSYSQITYSAGTFSVRSRDGYDMSNHPVVHVSWYGATAFCNYYGYRLPTEWEWQAVADYDGSYIYGCGTTIDQNKANYGYANPLGLSSFPFTSPVNHYSSYGYGMNDMAGNVWEWTSSCYYAACDYNYRVFRGGGWSYYDHNCTVSYRNSSDPSTANYHLGFRVCR